MTKDGVDFLWGCYLKKALESYRPIQIIYCWHWRHLYGVAKMRKRPIKLNKFEGKRNVLKKNLLLVYAAVMQVAPS